MPKDISLYNHSACPVVSRQISTSSGSTSSGRRHVTYSTNHIHVPQAGPSTVPHDDIDIDDCHDHDDHAQVNDPAPPTEVRGRITELPGIQVVAKPRAKRYHNSVRRIQIYTVDVVLTVAFRMSH
jgi:hypothetical protein